MLVADQHKLWRDFADQYKLWRDLTEEEKRNTVNLVNNLIEDSFGEGFSGDYSYKKNTADKGIGGVLERGNYLGVIAKENSLLKRIASFGLVGKFEGYVGLLNEDGSKITVLENFSEETRKYKEWYQNHPDLKKKVKIKKISKSEMHNKVYPIS